MSGLERMRGKKRTISNSWNRLSASMYIVSFVFSPYTR